MYVWYWFLELNNQRPSGMGLSTLLWSDIYSYFYLKQIEPSDSELSLLLQLDKIALKHFAKQQEEESKRKSSKSK